MCTLSVYYKNLIKCEIPLNNSGFFNNQYDRKYVGLRRNQDFSIQIDAQRSILANLVWKPLVHEIAVRKLFFALIRHQGSQKTYKRPTKAVKAKSKARA